MPASRPNRAVRSRVASRAEPLGPIGGLGRHLGRVPISKHEVANPVDGRNPNVAAAPEPLNQMLVADDHDAEPGLADPMGRAKGFNIGDKLKHGGCRFWGSANTPASPGQTFNWTPVVPYIRRSGVDS